jgi:hypothetical protein
MGKKQELWHKKRQIAKAKRAIKSVTGEKWEGNGRKFGS